MWKNCLKTYFGENFPNKQVNKVNDFGKKKFWYISTYIARRDKNNKKVHRRQNLTNIQTRKLHNLRAHVIHWKEIITRL